MNKLFKSLLLPMLAICAFTACEDVPEPYEKPGTGKNDPTNSTQEGVYLSEDFSSSFGTFTSTAVTGTPWIIDHKTAKASGYNNGETTASKAYLVSPAIDLSQATEAYLTFQYILAYTATGAENKVLITDSYNADNVEATPWTDITGSLTPWENKNWDKFSTYAKDIPAAFLGKSGVRIAFYYSCTSAGSMTWEVKNVQVLDGKAPETEEETPSVDAVNTMETAITVAEALTVVDGLEEGQTTDKWYFIKGKVKRITTTGDNVAKYNNINYYITDDGSNEIQVYNGRNLNNTDFTKDGELNVGDEVIVVGKLMKYKNNNSGAIIPEVASGNYIVKLTAGQGNTDEVDAVNTLETPINVAEALNVVNALADGQTTEKWYYLKGKVKKINTTGADVAKYKNINYYITDDGSNEIQVYRGRNLGNTDFTKDGELNVGDEVIVVGKLMKYINTKTNAVVPEVADGNYIVKFVSRAENVTPDNPDVPQPTGNNLLTNGNFETWADGLPTGWKSASTASSANLSQSTDAHGGSYSVVVEGNASSNKRLASKELTLKAGDYTFSFYAKSTTGDPAQVRPGMVPITDKLSYSYGDYASINNAGWTLVSYSFTLSSESTVCLVVMNPKTSTHATAQNVLIDDAMLTTTNGGLAGGNTEEPTPQPSTEVKAISVAEFNAAAVDANVWYQLTGTVKNLKDGDQYGNFDLEDSTGSVYVYGVLSEKGGAKRQFQTLAAEKGIKNGSTLTIIGTRGDYNGKIEVVNAYFVSVSN